MYAYRPLQLCCCLLYRDDAMSLATCRSQVPSTQHCFLLQLCWVQGRCVCCWYTGLGHNAKFWVQAILLFSSLSHYSNYNPLAISGQSCDELPAIQRLSKYGNFIPGQFYSPRAKGKLVPEPRENWWLILFSIYALWHTLNVVVWDEFKIHSRISDFEINFG